MSNDEVLNQLDLIQLYMPETNHNVWFGFHYISCVWPPGRLPSSKKVEISRVINEQKLTHTLQTGEKYFSHAWQNFFLLHMRIQIYWRKQGYHCTLNYNSLTIFLFDAHVYVWSGLYIPKLNYFISSKSS